MRVLVVAKAPVPGQAKTRLGARVGDVEAARVAAAALVDTLRAAAEFAGPAGCHLALSGDLDRGMSGRRIRGLLRGWTVSPQRGRSFAERLVRAHQDAGPGAVLQIGTDTPQVTPELLETAAGSLADHDTALGPADDGGWWLLGRRQPESVRPIGGVPMSTSSTYDRTREALLAAGATVAVAPPMRDVDTVADARVVAAAAPQTEFARTWATVGCA